MLKLLGPIVESFKFSQKEKNRLSHEFTPEKKFYISKIRKINKKQKKKQNRGKLKTIFATPAGVLDCLNTEYSKQVDTLLCTTSNIVID